MVGVVGMITGLESLTVGDGCTGAGEEGVGAGAGAGVEAGGACWAGAETGLERDS